MSRIGTVQFRGSVKCRRDGEGPVGLILIGTTIDAPGETAQLAFSAAAPADLPGMLEDVRVESIAGSGHRIVSGSREWMIAGAAHLHRDVSSAFYQAIPGRAVPWSKRMFWRLALALAASRLGRQILFRLR